MKACRSWFFTTPQFPSVNMAWAAFVSARAIFPSSQVTRFPDLARCYFSRCGGNPRESNVAAVLCPQ